MSNLLNPDHAIAKILETIQRLSAESVVLEDSLGRILAEDILSDTNLPPFDNSAMDGFAILSGDSSGASQSEPVVVHVSMDIPAGKAPDNPIQSGQAARIMTGAPIPDGADAVIPVEDTNADFSDPQSSIIGTNVQLYKETSPNSNIRKSGQNIAVGQKVLTASTEIRPAEIGILASIGKPSISVLRKPRVVIIGSGDELISVDEALTPGKIRDSNSYALHALVRQDGCEGFRLAPAKDTPESIRGLFQNAQDLNPDVIISSAGVSVGAADYVRGILEEMGQVDFWRINMRPGKPVAFGFLEGIPFFGLPGNPVSAMVTYDVIVRPALLKMAGRKDSAQYETVTVGQEMHSDGRRTFARVILRREGNEIVAYESGTQSSGAHMSMVIADGLLIIPENTRTVEKGSRLQVRLLKGIHSIE